MAGPAGSDTGRVKDYSPREVAALGAVAVPDLSRDRAGKPRGVPDRHTAARGAGGGRTLEGPLSCAPAMGAADVRAGAAVATAAVVDGVRGRAGGDRAWRGWLGVRIQQLPDGRYRIRWYVAG